MKIESMMNKIDELELEILESKYLEERHFKLMHLSVSKGLVNFKKSLKTINLELCYNSRSIYENIIAIDREHFVFAIRVTNTKTETNEFINIANHPAVLE